MDLIKFDLTEDEKKGFMSRRPGGMYEKWIHSYDEILRQKNEEIKDLIGEIGKLKQQLKKLKLEIAGYR